MSFCERYIKAFLQLILMALQTSSLCTNPLNPPSQRESQDDLELLHEKNDVESVRPSELNDGGNNESSDESSDEGSDDEGSDEDSNCNDDDDEVDLLLHAKDSRDVLELISTDPEHYINLVNTYKKLPDGQPICLPDLFNLLARRDQYGRLSIKFRVVDNGPWYEVGYDSDNFNDNDVYRAFTAKVQDVLYNKPQDDRVHLKADLDEGGMTNITKNIASNASNSNAGDNGSNGSKPQKATVTELPIPPSQGNQNKINKLDRFRDQQKHKDELPVAPIHNDNDNGNVSGKGNEGNDGNEGNEPAVSINKTHDVILQPLLDSYKARIKPVLPTIQHLNRESQNCQVLKLLNNLSKECPAEMAADYQSLLTALDYGINPFLNKVLGTLSYANKYQAPLITHFVASHVSNNSVVLTHEQLCKLLNLSSKDRALLENYGVNLQKVIGE
jgi:hypothetical protein